MGTFPELLRFRAGLMSDAYRLPGLLERQQAAQHPVLQGPPMPQQAPAPQATPPVQPQGGGGIGGTLGQIFGGVDDPNLTPEQNQQARRMALIQAGLATLASQQSGLGAVAEGGLVGQQAGAQARQAIYGRTQQERIANALQDPAIMAKLTPEQQAWVRVAPADEVIKVFKEVLFPAPGETKLGKPGDFVLGPNGETLRQLPQGNVPANPDAALETAMVENGVSPETFRQQPPELQQQIIARSNAIRQGNQRPPAVVNISTGDKAAGEQYARSQSEADTATELIDTLGTMESLLENDPSLTGVLADATITVRGLGASLGLPGSDKLDTQQFFKALESRNVLSSADELSGPKSDNDIKFLREQWPSLKSTPGGNLLLIRYLKAKEQRKIDKANAADAWMADPAHNGSLVGFRAEWAKYVKANPIEVSKLFTGSLPKAAPGWGGG